MMKQTLFFLIFILFTPALAAVSLSLDAQRKVFLQVQDDIEKEGSPLSFKQNDILINYPLYPYIQYQWLKRHLDETKKIKAFLKKYKETRYAGLLRYKWQIYLAKHKQWSEFIRQYQVSSNTRLQCHYYRAKYNTGAKKQALLGAKKIWVVGRSQPSECDPIFKVLLSSTYFTRDMLWQRFEAAVLKNKLSIAKYVKKLMNKKDQKIAQLWLKVHSNPLLIEKQNILEKSKPRTGKIFAHGVSRLASRDIEKAISLWDAQNRHYKIKKQTVRKIERRLAMSLVLSRNDRAYSRLSKLSKPDNVAKEWRVRAALRAENWPAVEKSISVLNEKDKNKEKWRYWLARASENVNKSDTANLIYSKLADERSFYGYLSAEKLNKNYQLSNNPIQVEPEMLEKFKNKKDFLVVAEFISVDKPKEAKRQWWYALRKLDKKQILLAAKYAEELNWIQVAIHTIAKAKYWDDVGVRFPLAYTEKVQQNAKRQDLNPAIIFGLIRRESAFNSEAHSPVGARGLMQIMPRTGRQIAKELKEKWKGQGEKGLLNPSVNLKYGSYYYKQLLEQFNGHYALAAAAYNAGPHRVKKWLPSKRTLAADIWIETIPFKETRGYVSAVLTYALIYQKQLKKNTLSMKVFMQDILPK